MTFPQAHNGVKKLFISEIVIICSAILAIIVAVLTSLPGGKEEGNPLFGAAAGLAVAVGVAAIVAFILQVIGLYQAGKDDGYLRTAFWVVIFGLILSIVVTILKAVKVDGTVISIMDSISDVLEVVVSVYTLFGISVLAERLNDTKMALYGRRLAILVVVLFAASIILGLIPSFVKEPNEVVAGIFAAFAIIASIIELIVYVLTFIYLGKAVKMLKK